jgi:hypothetical protein
VISLRSRSYLTDRRFAEDIERINLAIISCYVIICVLYKYSCVMDDVSLKFNWVNAQFLYDKGGKNTFIVFPSLLLSFLFLSLFFYNIFYYSFHFLFTSLPLPF